MSVAPAVTETTYLLSASILGPFATVWPYADPAEVAAFLDAGDGAGPQPLAQPAQYTVASADPLAIGGNVTLNGALVPGGGWPAGAKLSLVRATSNGQPSVFGEDLGFSPAACEAALDNVERQVQEIRAALQRSISVPYGESGGMLPPASERGGMFLGFDGAGNPILLPGTDGGDATLRADLASTASGAALVAFLQIGGASAVARTLMAKAQERVTPLDFGAQGNGIADCRNAFLAADATGHTIVVPKGTYYIGAPMTLASRVVFEMGAALKLLTSVVVTFNGGVEAPTTQIFQNACAGQGTILFSVLAQLVGFAEWWGAVIGDTGTDSRPALEAAHIALPLLRLLRGTYYTLATTVFNTSNHWIVGQGGNTFNQWDVCSQIGIQSATLDCVRVGPATNPGGGPNSFLYQLQIHNVAFNRTAYPAPPALGDITTGCASLRAQYVQSCYFKQCFGLGSIHNFYVFGNVYTKYVECFSKRDFASSPSSGDRSFGWFVDSRTIPGDGTNTGIASLYITQCGAYCNPGIAPGGRFGIYTYAGMTDMFINGFETAGCGSGIELHGSSASVNYGSEDTLVVNCVLDQCDTYGILIDGGNDPHVNVNVSNNYCATASGGTAISVSPGTDGAVTIAGNELIATPGAGAIGIHYQGKGVTSYGNRLTDFNEPEKFDGAVDCYSANIINNPTGAGTTGAVAINSGSRLVVAPIIHGPVAKFAYGVGLATGVTFVEARMSGVNPATITGGATNKLVFNGVPVTTTGVFGTNCLAQGIMA